MHIISMATYNNKNESSSKTMSSIFNRSLTMRSNPTYNQHIYSSVLNRSGSIKSHADSKLYNSMISAGISMRGKVMNFCSIFETTVSLTSHAHLQEPKLVDSKKPGSNLAKGNATGTNDVIRLPGTEDRIVLYFTSLRGVRRTFEDCYAVRMIFKGFRVWVDERDISMDCAYKIEIQSLFGKKSVSLPQVFIRGELFGRAETIKMMFETGELAKIRHVFPRQKPGFVCESCGDVRFVPCWICSGSRKVFDEIARVPKRCFECNENGLIRCPDCCC